MILVVGEVLNEVVQICVLVLVKVVVGDHLLQWAIHLHGVLCRGRVVDQMIDRIGGVRGDGVGCRVDLCNIIHGRWP